MESLHSFFSGEGFACEFEGEGDIYVGSGMGSDGSNVLQVFMESAGEKIGEWVGRASFAAILASGVIYFLPEDLKKEIPQLAMKIFLKMLEHK